MARRPLAYMPDQDLHYSKQQRGKIPPVVKQIHNFKLFNAGLKTFMEAKPLAGECQKCIEYRGTNTQSPVEVCTESTRL
jgi:hypothetical protein